MPSRIRLDKTQVYNSYCRRLDTLARYLTGDSVCVAVTLDNNHRNPCLLISSNKLPNPNPATSKSATEITSLLEKLLSIPKEPTEPRKIVYPYICKVFLKSYLTKQESLLGFITKAFIDIQEAQDIQELVKYLDKYNHSTHLQTLLKIINNWDGSLLKKMPTRAERKDIGTAQDRQEAQKLRESIFEVEEFVSTLKRIVKDANKICHIMLTNDFLRLKSAIEQKQFHFIGPSQPSAPDKDSHAEINLATYLQSNGEQGVWYFGISKLSCFNCASDIETINAISADKMHILTRGAHNVDYSSSRKAITLDTTALSTFTPQTQGRTKELADSSDSEVELAGDIAE